MTTADVLRALAAKHADLSTVLYVDLDRDRDVRVSDLLLDEADRLEVAS